MHVAYLDKLEQQGKAEEDESNKSDKAEWDTFYNDKEDEDEQDERASYPTDAKNTEPDANIETIRGHNVEADNIEMEHVEPEAPGNRSGSEKLSLYEECDVEGNDKGKGTLYYLSPEIVVPNVMNHEHIMDILFKSNIF
ncbi:hypothetical protein OPQ81_002867 [Rhizoctonia solani]|nr:hypothetical protein OPQ81_002867 [Rhizoctonia solani]